MLDQIKREIANDPYYQQNFSNDGERFVAWYFQKPRMPSFFFGSTRFRIERSQIVSASTRTHKAPSSRETSEAMTRSWWGSSEHSRRATPTAFS